MPWQTPPTFVNGNVLTAAQLNILSDDVEMLWGLVGGGINLPITSLALGTTQWTSSNNQWLVYHINRYLHYKLRLTTGDNYDLEIFYNSARVYHDSTNRGAAYTYSGYVDLNNPELWSDWVAAWLVTTGYTVYDIVSNGGVYYRCIGNHTSSAGDEPGVGAGWTTYWVSLGAAGAFAAAGSYYYIYATTDLQNSGEIIGDYFLESDATSL